MMELETFREIGPYEKRQLTQSEPSCDNGKLRIRKWRVTVELVDEPLEVIHERIRTLWAKKNHHHAGKLLAAAKEYGLCLDDEEELSPTDRKSL